MIKKIIGIILILFVLTIFNPFFILKPCINYCGPSLNEMLVFVFVLLIGLWLVFFDKIQIWANKFK